MKRHIILLAALAMFAASCGNDNYSESSKKPSGNTTDEPLYEGPTSEEENKEPTIDLRPNLFNQPTHTIIYKVLNDFSWAEFNSGRMISISVAGEAASRQNDDKDEWDAAMESLQPLLSKMKEQHLNSSWKYNFGEYIFDTAASLSIVANTTLGGRAAGEELCDLFNVWSNMPQYVYPDGDLMEEKERFIGVEKWLQAGYTLPICFNLIPKTPFPDSEFISNLEIWVKLELKGAGLIIDTKYCYTLSPNNS